MTVIPKVLLTAGAFRPERRRTPRDGEPDPYAEREEFRP